MNINEAIEKIKSVAYNTGTFFKVMEVSLDKVIEIVEQIDTQPKPRVPEVAVEFYETYKDQDLSFEEWFGDFYSKEAEEDFPRLQELAKWLYDNPDEVNRQRELALATLIVNGLDAVEVETEQLYVVEIPNSNENVSVYLYRTTNGCIAINTIYNNPNWKEFPQAKLTESEIKQDFEWAWRWAKPAEVE